MEVRGSVKGRVLRMIRHALALTVLGVLGLAATALATTPDVPTGAGVWSGSSSASAGSPGLWSDTSNWSANAPAADSTEPLYFGAQSGQSGCAEQVLSGASAGCYSEDDLGGVAPSSFTIDDGSPYKISAATGEALTIGGGGLTGSTSATFPNVSNPNISLPITLGADQAWTLAGTGTGSPPAAGQTPPPPGGGLTVSGALTGDHTLGVTLSDGATLNLSGTDSVGAFTATGESPSNTGDNAGYNGILSVGNDLNAGGDPITATDLDVQFGVPQSNGELSTGPLTLAGDRVIIGQSGGGQNGAYAGIVSSSGAASIDSASETSMYIDSTDSSPVAGTDFSQLKADGNVTVGGYLSLYYGGSSSGSQCPSLPPGTTYPLVEADGVGNALSGRFSGIPDGDVIYIGAFCNGSDNPTAIPVRINYTSTEVTATALATSTTAVSASPQPAVTNQPVTLTATVTQSAGTPAGTVAFFDGISSYPITGCGSEPVSQTGGSGPYTATCTTSFDATDDLDESYQPSITAEYTPASGNDTDGSVSSADGQGDPLTINKQNTTTALSASRTTPTAGQAVTYTATVTPTDYPTPTIPLHTVTFLDGSTPVNCTGSNAGLLSGTTPDTATCTTNYSTSGTHSITAEYQGDDGNFNSSTSSAQAVTVSGGSSGSGTGSGTGGGTGSGSSSGSHPGSPGTGTAKLGSPKTSGTVLTIPVSCANGGPSCTLTFKETVVETLQGGKIIGVAARKRAKTKKTIVVATAKVTLQAGQSKTVHISLNGTGKRLLARHHGLKIKLAVTESGRSTAVAVKTVSFKAPKKKSKKK